MWDFWGLSIHIFPSIQAYNCAGINSQLANPFKSYTCIMWRFKDQPIENAWLYACMVMDGEI